MIFYIDRKTGKREKEKVFGEKTVAFLYGKSPLAKFFRHQISRTPFYSKLYGWIQSLSLTKYKVIPFIKKYEVDASEFEKKPEEFTSFNDFFTRKLKEGARLIPQDVAIIPADGRYRFFPNISKSEGFYVKGKKFNLRDLLQDEALANKYEQGTMVIGRLCPSDYHRFHFPCDGEVLSIKMINGWLYSVNPAALRHNIHIFTENKRSITEIETKDFGTLLYIEVGATSVGTIHQTYSSSQVKKGEEKGYFSFGGSAIILLFEPGKITLADDLKGDEEIKCQMGELLGQLWT